MEQQMLDDEMKIEKQMFDDAIEKYVNATQQIRPVIEKDTITQIYGEQSEHKINIFTNINHLATHLVDILEGDFIEEIHNFVIKQLIGDEHGYDVEINVGKWATNYLVEIPK